MVVSAVVDTTFIVFVSAKLAEEIKTSKQMNDDNNLKDFMQAWFEQFMGRFDRLDKFMDIMSGRHNVLNGERLLDNQDLCQMLNVSRRTLQ